MADNEQLPRISVDTIHDWQRVTASFDDALDAAIERVLSQADNKDALRLHLKQWRDATFEAVKPNLRINGHSFSDLNEQGVTEPFDEVLDRSIWALSAERIAWDKTLSDRRRSAPLEIEEHVQEMLDKQVELEPPMPSGADMVVDSQPPFTPNRLRDIAATHASMSETLHHLSTQIPELQRKKDLVAEAAQDILPMQ